MHRLRRGRKRGLGLTKINCKEKGNSRQRAFAARKQVNALKAFAPGPRCDDDGGLEGIFVGWHGQIGFAAFKKFLECVLEVFSDAAKGIEKTLARRAVDARDGALDDFFGLQKVVALVREKFKAFFLNFVLFECREVDRSHASHALLQFVGLFFRHIRVKFWLIERRPCSAISTS